MPRKSNLTVPPSWSAQDRRFGDSVKENLDVLLGHRGDALDRAVTFKDLLDTGIVTLARGVSLFGDTRDLVPSRDEIPNLDIPPAPTNLQASGVFQNIILTWDLSLYEGHSYVEVFRHTSDDISAATMVAQVSGFTGVYADPVGGGLTRYYWVRAVNQAGVSGPFNSSTGTSGTTATDVALVLNLLANQITNSELATELSTPIGKVDTIESLLSDIEDYTGYTSTYSADNLLTRITSTDTAVTSLNTSVSSINSSLTTLTGNVSNLQTSITDLTANVGTVYVQTSAPTGTIATNSRWYDSDDNMAVYYYSGTAWVSLQDPRIASNQSSITTLNAEVFNTDGSSKLASATAFNTLDTTVTNLSGTVTTVSSDVTSLKNVVFDSNGNSQIATTSALSNLTSQVTSNDGDISALVTDVTALDAEVFNSDGTARLATGSALSTLQTTVNTQGNSISTSQADITALEGAVFDNSGAVKLATTAALTALTSTVTSQGSSISSTQSDVTALNGVVFDSNGNSQLATSAALAGLTSDVTAIYDGNNSSIVKTIQTDVTQLEASVFDSGGNLQLATTTALSGLTNDVEAIYDGSNPSVVKTIQGDVTDLETEVFNSNGTSRLATATALSSLTTDVRAIYDGNNASVVKSISEDVTSLNNAVFDANGNVELASASAVSLLQTEVWGSGVTPGGATTSRIDSLTSTINDPTSGLSATSSAVGTLTTEVFPNGSSNASSIDALNSAVFDANTGSVKLASASAVGALETEVFGTGGASASRIDGLFAEVFNANGSSRLATSSALSSLTSRVTTAEGTINGHTTSINANSSDITALENTVNNPSTGVAATSSALNSLSSTVSSQGNSISANASSLSSLSTTVAGNTTSISTQGSSINGLQAKYVVKIDNNGAVAGYGLASTANSAGNITSEFIVNADRFAIMRGGSNTAAASVPFVVQTSSTTLGGETVPAGVYIDAAFIKNGSIQSAKIADAAIGNAKIANLDAGKINAGTISTSRLNIDGSTLTSNNGVLQVNALNANVITSGLINSSRINIDNVTLDTDGQGRLIIKNLGVDTLQIKGNAVTVPTSAYSSAANGQAVVTVAKSSSYTGIQSLSYTSNGSPALIFASFTAINSGGRSHNVTAVVKKGGTIIHTQTRGVSNGVIHFNISFTDFSTAAGSVTYTLEARNNGNFQSSGTGADERSLAVIEVKK